MIPCIVCIIALCWSIGDLDSIQKFLIAVSCYRFNDVIRCPLIATCTFRVNNANKQMRTAKQRELNRQREIQAALKQRIERKSPQEMIEMREISPNVPI